MSETTVLYDWHVGRDARMVAFAGYRLPVQYEGVLAEHKQCRTAAALFDTSHMGQLLFRGPDAAEQLDRLLTQGASRLDVGRGRYGFLLEPDGGVIDDAIVMRLDEEEFLLVVNAGTAVEDREWAQSHLGGDVELTDLRADGWAKIDLQGPAAFDVLARFAEFELRELRYFRCRRGRLDGRDGVVSRTGYTGELGYEIMAPGEDIAALWDRLVADERVRPAGLGARDSLRLEMCLPLYGHELSRERTPVEAGLTTFLGEHEFIGATAVRARMESGADERLIAFRSNSRRRAMVGNDIVAGGRTVGTVTSGAFSPMLGVSIGMGYVKAGLGQPGTELTVDTGRAELEVAIAERPLYTEGSCRKKLT